MDKINEKKTLNLMLSDPTLLRNKAYIGGEWIASNSGKTFSVLNPATLEVIADLPDLGEDEAKLLNAIVDAVNSVNKDTIQNKFNLEDAKKIILAMEDIKGIISFIPDIGTLDLSMPYVQSSSLKKMISDTESKKILWKKLKEIILK